MKIDEPGRVQSWTGVPGPTFISINNNLKAQMQAKLEWDGFPGEFENCRFF